MSVAIESHLIVTPARNEAHNLPRLAQCLIEQAWPPTAWIVVDNGSTDETPDVVRELGSAHSWIRLVSIEDEIGAKRGRSSVRAFNAGVAGASERQDLVTSPERDGSFGTD